LISSQIYLVYIVYIIEIMAQIPQLSPQVRDMLTAKGYDGNAVHEANRLPNFAIPGTTACT
jgi:hypothetical protein